MSELIKRQDAIDVVAKSYRYESDRMTALQELPVITELECLDAVEMAKIAIAMQKLKEYQQLEEQGLLLRLPCKVGDAVYAIPSWANYRLNKSLGHAEKNRVYQQIVDHIEYNSYGYLISTNEGMTVHRQEVFGETWFLAKEEAEQALADRQSK